MTQSGMNDSTTANREERRILRFLALGGAEPRPAASAGRMLLDGGERGVVGVDAAALSALEARGLVARRAGALTLTATARAALKRAAASVDPLRAPPQEPGRAVVVTEAGRETVTVNRAESPLALLRSRKGKDGRPFLDAREFGAGERLRADYTRGQIMPRLGVNWDAAGSAGGRQGGAGGGIVELTDAALAARRRVETALGAVGPELSGVLVDVCCFLKGLEQVEAERGWPARSAKVVLKSALGALARHYEPLEGRAAGRTKPAILHWGAPGYRPELGQP